MDAGWLKRAIFMTDEEINSDNWNNKFTNMLRDFDLIDYWNENRIIPLDTVKEKIDEQFQTNWRHKFSTKPKLLTC